MGVLETIAILLSCSLCLYLLLFLIKILHRIWWTPIRIRRVMNSQGIRGPPYRLIQGNTKEILSMQTATTNKPMDLSHNIFPRLQPHLHSWLNTYGKIILTWHGHKAQLVITESEYAKEIIKDKEKIYPKADTEGFLKKLFGDGVATSKGGKWAKQRNLANHAFYAESVKSMVPAMIESVEMMLERWKHHEGKEIELFQEFRVLTLDVISRTAFGSSYLEGKVMFEMLRKMVIIYSTNLLRTKLPVLEPHFVDSVDNWEDMVQRSYAKFFLARERLTSLSLAKEAQEQNEDIIEYCKRFRDRAVDCTELVKEDQFVNICIGGMLPEFQMHLVNLLLQTFSALLESAYNLRAVVEPVEEHDLRLANSS